MIDPRDRLLERSLVRLLGGEPEAPDLAPRVLDAWQRGVRAPVQLGAGNHAEDALEDADAGPAESASPWPLRVGVAAALAAALGAGLWRALDWTGEPRGTAAETGLEPIAREGPLAPTQPNLAGPWRATKPSALPAAFGSLEALAGAILTVDGGGISLGSGALRVAADTAAATVQLPGDARLDLAPGSRARVELSLDRPPAPGNVDLGAWWSGERGSAYGRLTIEVTGKGARLHGLGPARTLDGPSRYYVGPGGLDEDLGQGAALVAELASLPADDLPIPGRIERWTRASLDGPLVTLREDPALWLEAGPVLGDLLARDAAPPALQGILIDALAQDRSPIALRVLREAWMGVPERYSSDAIVTLADRGLPEFVREVHGAMRHWNVAGSPEGDALPLALWLALQGKGDGALALAESLDFAREEVEGRFRTGSAAVGLARLGDRGPWLRFRKLEAARIEKSLAAEDLKGAVGALAGLEYLAAMLGESALPLPDFPVQPAYAGTLVGEYIQERLSAYATADEVLGDLRAVLER